VDSTILSVILGKWKVNTYLIQSGNDAWLIDPSDDYPKLESALLLGGANILGIICTHGHFDHISNVATIQSKYQVPSYIHSGDLRLVRQVNLYRKLAGGTDFGEVPKIDFKLEEFSELPLGKDSIRVIPAPGHTKGSVVFAFGRSIFTGDLYYGRTIGRTDLPGGDTDLIRSTAKFIFAEFEDYLVYPGHGDPFTLDSANIDLIVRSFDGG